MTFWYLSFFNSKYLVALSGAGLISNTAPADSTSTVGGGDSPSYSGFFHCLAVSDDQSSPCFSPNSCVLQNVRNASPRVFYPVLIFGSSRATCILSYMTIRFANKLILKSILCSIVFSTWLNSFSKINCLSFYFLDPLVYSLEHPSTPASGMLPTGLQYNGYFINTLFITSTHHCLSLLIAFNTLSLSELLCFLLLWM